MIPGGVLLQGAKSSLAATFVFAAVSLAHPAETGKTEQKDNYRSDGAAH